MEIEFSEEELNPKEDMFKDDEFSEEGFETMQERFYGMKELIESHKMPFYEKIRRMQKVRDYEKIYNSLLKEEYGYFMENN